MPRSRRPRRVRPKLRRRTPFSRVPSQDLWRRCPDYLLGHQRHDNAGHRANKREDPHRRVVSGLSSGGGGPRRLVAWRFGPEDQPPEVREELHHLVHTAVMPPARGSPATRGSPQDGNLRDQPPAARSPPTPTRLSATAISERITDIERRQSCRRFSCPRTSVAHTAPSWCTASAQMIATSRVMVTIAHNG